MKLTHNHTGISTDRSTRSYPVHVHPKGLSFGLLGATLLLLSGLASPVLSAQNPLPLKESSPSPSPSPSPSASPSPSPSPSASPSPSPSPSASPSPSPSASPSPSPSPNSTPTSQPVNISTRLRVESGEGVMVGGFIITGNAPKRIIVRGVGPSLATSGLTDLIEDPTLQLFAAGGQIAFNDDWRDLQESEIAATTIAPTDDREPAIVATLNPGPYTAIVSGKNGVTGVGLLEVYDLNTSASSKLANISTRGSIQTQDNVMIGGFILGGANLQPAKVVVRAIGPSLGNAGILNPLSNPTLQLFDDNGQSVGFNDNWQDDAAQAAELQALHIAPTAAAESAIVATLPPGPYTAVVAGQSGETGVGLVEIYDIQP